MANRCPRCRNHELELETFGIFRCASCGRMTIDGGPITDGSSDAPAVVHAGGATFAAAPRAQLGTTTARPPMPRMVFTVLALDVLLSIAKVLLHPGTSLVRMAARASAFVAVLVGNESSVRYAGAAMGTVLGADLVTLGWWWAEGTAFDHGLVLLLSAVDVIFVGVLFSPDARRHSGSSD